MGYYEALGKKEKPSVALGKFIELCSPDGYYWQWNRMVGEFYKRHGKYDEAKEQYRLALQGCKQFIEDENEHRRQLGAEPISDASWQYTRLRTLEALNK